MRKPILLLPFLIEVIPSFAQDNTTQPQNASGDIYANLLLIAVLITLLLALAASLVLLQTVKIVSAKLGSATEAPVAIPKARETIQSPTLPAKNSPGILSRILSLKSLEDEKDILMEHQFDGISELDNPTPAWFMWLFYGTIIFGACYLLNYHVFRFGKLQEEEYVLEMKTAAVEKDAYLAKSAGNIDENSVKTSTEASVISSGMAIFKANCVACHGENAQGVVGPNLTDNYWLHGGKINSIFKTVKYGIPEKGMISWEKTLAPKQISDVANYILSLKGSNPANPKAPQGTEEN